MAPGWAPLRGSFNMWHVSPAASPCRNCGATRFVDGSCERCRRQLLVDYTYLEEVESRANAVVDAAYDEYLELRAPDAIGLRAAVIELADTLRQWHSEAMAASSCSTPSR